MKVEISITLEDLEKCKDHAGNIKRNATAIAINRVLRSGYFATAGTATFCIFFNSKGSREFEALCCEGDVKYHGLFSDKLRRANIMSLSYPVAKPVGEYEIEIPDKFLRSEITEVK